MRKDVDNLLISQMCRKVEQQGVTKEGAKEILCENNIACLIVWICGWNGWQAGSVFCYALPHSCGVCHASNTAHPIPASNRTEGRRLMPEQESAGQKNTSIKNIWQLNYIGICIWTLLSHLPPLHYHPQDHYHGCCCCNRDSGEQHSNRIYGILLWFLN